MGITDPVVPDSLVEHPQETHPAETGDQDVDEAGPEPVPEQREGTLPVLGLQSGRSELKMEEKNFRFFLKKILSSTCGFHHRADALCKIK